MKLLSCTFCGETIDAEVIHKRRYSTKRMPKHFFCNGEHRDQWLVAQNHHSRVGKLGNATIADIKAKTGHMPGPQRGGARPGSGRRKESNEMAT